MLKSGWTRPAKVLAATSQQAPGKRKAFSLGMEAERLSSEEIPLALCSILHSCQAAQKEHWLLIQKIRICVYRLMTSCRSSIMLYPSLFSTCFYILPWCVCLEKENSSVNLLPASHSSFPPPPSLPSFLPAKPADIFVCLSCCYATRIEGGKWQYHKLKFSSIPILDHQS